METLITNGIKVSVDPYYQARHSKPKESYYVFAYQVTIENLSDQTVQLLRRHWYIIDSKGPGREVEGDGVIGQQPVLSPGQSHKYVSWVPLQTEIGKMFGTFLMTDMDQSSRFLVRIPEFKLIAPFKYN